MGIYEDYCEGKKLLGMLQYFKTRKRLKEKQMINAVGLSRVVETQLKQTISSLKKAYVLDGYSDNMKRELTVMTNMNMTEAKILPFIHDKYMVQGEKEAQKMLKMAMEKYS